MLKYLAVVIATIVGASAAHATSHQVNIKPVRSFIENKLLDKSQGQLKLTNKLTDADIGKGISKSAVQKANQTRQGFSGFNYGLDVDNYVVKMGKQKLLVTSARGDIAWDGGSTSQKGERFVARSGQKGLVVARGNILDGKISWTRSHNDHAKTSPAERNAGK